LAVADCAWIIAGAADHMKFANTSAIAEPVLLITAMLPALDQVIPS
jgi:hypothetical protein